MRGRGFSGAACGAIWHGMKRRPLLLVPFALLAGAFPALAQVSAAALSPQDRADVGRIEAYLNSVRSLTARFLQVAPDGGLSRGQAWLVRPGRLRFQYDPPVPFLLVGGHGLLVFHDSQLNQTSNIPLDSTPLGLLLQDNLRLSGEITIVSFQRQPGQLQVGGGPHAVAAGRGADADLQRPAAAAAANGRCWTRSGTKRG